MLTFCAEISKFAQFLHQPTSLRRIRSLNSGHEKGPHAAAVLELLVLLLVAVLQQVYDLGNGAAVGVVLWPASPQHPTMEEKAGPVIHAMPGDALRADRPRNRGDSIGKT